MPVTWRSTRTIATALAVVGLGAFAGGCGSSSDDAAGDPATDKLAQILERGTLVLSTDLAYPPQSMEVGGATRLTDTKCPANELTANQVEGYDTEVGKLVARELGVEPCFVTPSWTEITSGNWGDRWDISYGSGSINEDRMQRLWMTQPYYAVPNSYFVAKSSPARSVADLAGKTIGACAGCSHEAYLADELVIPGVEIVRNVERPKVRTFESEPPGLEATARGEVDAFLAADPVGQAEIDAGTPLRRLPEVAFVYYPSGFVDKGSGLDSGAFVARVHEIVQGLLADGTLSAESKRWFGHDYASAAADYDIAALDQQVP